MIGYTAKLFGVIFEHVNRTVGKKMEHGFGKLVILYNCGKRFTS